VMEQPVADRILKLKARMLACQNELDRIDPRVLPETKNASPKKRKKKK